MTMRKIEKKIKLSHPFSWANHRGGWRYVVDILLENFHHPHGVLFVSAIENVMVTEVPILEPWIGVVHQVPRHYIREFPDLVRMLESETWKRSIPYCQGLFVISKYVQHYLEANGVSVPINHIYYPVDPDCLPFDYDSFMSHKNRRVLFVGEFLRRFESFEQLEAPGYEKAILSNEEFEKSRIDCRDITVYPCATDEAYDVLLKNSIIFVDLYDAPANTLVIECLIRNTPLLINRLPGIVEYLGEDYPFYFDSIEEANRKLANDDIIKSTYEYLQSSPMKSRIGKAHFIEHMATSTIYRNLPPPQIGQQIAIDKVDVSVVICSYNRVYNIDHLLQCFCGQHFDGNFEIILWNNNIDKKEELESIVSGYRDRLLINLIHSTENYYCAIRLTVASFAKADLLLICDDDVKPGVEYIAHFVKKYRQYGPEAVICCRGHVFLPHTLNEESPHLAWDEHTYLEFYDETKDDMRIHFFHADNCLIPKSVLLRANTFDWPSYDFILVDDYWLSFIIQHKLDIPVWKVKADDHLSFTPCADAPNIALFHNKHVSNERINFYIYHMRNKWPNFGYPTQPV